jgi:hypothetical protein
MARDPLNISLTPEQMIQRRLAELEDRGYPVTIRRAGGVGIIGPPGEKGAKGDTGEKGSTGEKGAKGDTGEKGSTGEKGATGSTGEKGATGSAGRDAGVAYKFLTNTENTEPASGRLKLNNIIALATVMRIRETDLDGLNQEPWIGAFDDSTTTEHRGYLTLRNITSGGRLILEITGAGEDKGTYWNVPVKLAAVSGAFSDEDELRAEFSRTGDKGATGEKGEKGSTGEKGEKGSTGEKGEKGATGEKGEKGSTGEKGEAGPTGPEGRDATSLYYAFLSATTNSDPGAGNLKLNNAGLASATALYISETSVLGAVGNYLATVDDSTSTDKAYLYIREYKTPTNWALYKITGALTDNGTWDTITISYVDHSGAFSNTDEVALQFIRVGDKGSTGAQGEKGSTGIQGEKGSTGEKGAKGDTGEKGAKGDTGEKGAKGDTGEKGSTGEKGAKGDTGAPGGIQYIASTSTVEENPNQGHFRLNNATLSSATKLFISELDVSLSNQAAFIQSWDDGVGGYLTLLHPEGATTIFKRSSGSSSDKGAWSGLGLTFVSGVTTLDNEKQYALSFSRIGDTGEKGSTGEKGEKGSTGEKGDTGEAGSPDYKTSCRVATTANITIATALNSGDTIDGTVLANGDRVLVWKQTTTKENGIWVVAASPARATDADAENELSGGTRVRIESGTLYGGVNFALLTAGTIVPGTTSHEWGYANNWVGVSFQNSWENLEAAGTNQTVSYRKSFDNRVRVRGFAKRSATSTAAIFTLPEGFRPSKTEFFVGVANNGGVLTKTIVSVTSGGAVSLPEGAAKDYVSLSGVEFYAD